MSLKESVARLICQSKCFMSSHIRLVFRPLACTIGVYNYTVWGIWLVSCLSKQVNLINLVLRECLTGDKRVEPKLKMCTCIYIHIVFCCIL